MLATANPGVALHSSSLVSVKIVNKNGTTSVYINNSLRLTRSLTIPPSAFLTFTGSTGADYQYQEVLNLAVTAS